MKKKIIGIIVFLMVLAFLIPLLILKPIKREVIIEEEEENMKHYKFKDLEITSAKIPQNTHLWFETSAGVLYLVDSGDQTKLYKSTDKGDNWDLITTRTKKIQAQWYDRTNEEIYFGDSDLDLTTSYIWKLTLSDDSITEIENLANNSFHDIFDTGAINIWSAYTYNSAGDIILKFRKAPTIHINNMGAVGARTYDMSQIVLVSDVWFLWKWSDENVELWKVNLTTGAFTEMEDCAAATELPPTNQRAIAYDGSDILYFILQDTGDSKYYLYTYIISTDTLTKGAEYNIVLMLDRNCCGTVPNEYEKAFGITGTANNLKVYQIIPRRNTFMLIQDLSTITSTTGRHIIALTDNFLMLDSGLMFEYTNVSTYLENTRIHDGIIPYRKLFTFDCHPNYETYFNKGDLIDIWDVNDVLCFTGYIKTKSRDNNGIYKFSCQGMANEVFERTYDKSFSSDKTSEKLQDIIDNKLEFCYRDTSITATTTDYSYELNRACIYMFNLARYMERQVLYIEPDGKVWSKAYNALTATGKSWTLYDGNQNALLIDIPGLQDSIPGYYFGNTGITSVSVRYKDNTTAIRPATPVETFKKKRLKEFRDPKIQASTEANQLGDNLYNIFALDTIFLGMKIDGQGWLQPGKTIQIENTNQVAITQAHFLIVKFVYDPKNDVYFNMILSNNIITPKEFKSDLDTSQQQIHTATLQSFENQGNIPISKKRTVPLDIINNNATEATGFFLLDAAGEYVAASFWADVDVVDTSQDILFTWIIQPTAAGTLDIKKYQGAIKTDGSETSSWNIENGTADNKSVAQDRMLQWVYTWSAANIDGDDLLHALMYSNDVIDFRVYGCFVTYYLK